MACLSLSGIGHYDVNWLELTQNSAPLRTFVVTVMNFRAS